MAESSDLAAAATTELYASCQQTVGNSTNALILCVTQAILKQNMEERENIARGNVFTRSLYILCCGSLVFFMQAGFAMLCAGAVRRKNLQNTMLKNLLDACGSSLAFYCVGYAFAFGDGNNPNGFIGTRNFFLRDIDDFAFWFFQYSFSAAAATIVAGTLAERCQMSAYFFYSVMLSGWVYPVVVHAVWSANGFMSAIHSNPLLGVGMVDIAGSGVVHLTGGTTALVATWILGPRRGRFHDEQTGEPLDKPKKIQGHNVSLQVLGTMILWFGWYGFNSGSALLLGTPYDDILAALCVTNTTLAAGMGGLSALVVNLIIQERTTGRSYYDLEVAMNGVLSGLVGVTAGCGVMEPWAAVVTGFFAGILYLFGSWLLVRIRLDDAVDAIPVHMLNGIWGCLAVGLFASPTRLTQAFGSNDHPGFFYSIFQHPYRLDATLLLTQLIGILCIVAWVTIIMFPFFIFLESMGWFRSDPFSELAGLDKSLHGGLANVGNEAAIPPQHLQAFEKQLEKTIRSRSSNASVRSRMSGDDGSYRDNEQTDDLNSSGGSRRLNSNV